MFGDTLTVSNGTTNKVLSKINQDSYSSEYYLREEGQEFRIRIRHSKDALKKGSPSPQTERHSFELTRVEYDTATTVGRTDKAYITLLVPTSRPTYQGELVFRGILDFFSPANVTKLANWES